MKSGIVVVASSGDSGFVNSIGSPASAPDVISVGASTTFRSYAQTTENGFQLGNGSYRNNTVSALSSGGVTQPGRTIDLLAPGDLGWALCSAEHRHLRRLHRQRRKPSRHSGIRRQQRVGTVDRGCRSTGHPGVPRLPRRRIAVRVVGEELAHQHGRRPWPAGDRSGCRVARLVAGRSGRACRQRRLGCRWHATMCWPDPEQLDLTTAPGTAAHGDVQVTNISSHAEVVAAFVRGNGQVLDRSTATSRCRR